MHPYLARVLGVRLVDEMHQKEHVVRKVVFFLAVRFETARYLVQIVFADTANKARRLWATEKRYVFNT